MSHWVNQISKGHLVVGTSAGIQPGLWFQSFSNLCRIRVASHKSSAGVWGKVRNRKSLQSLNNHLVAPRELSEHLCKCTKVINTYCRILRKILKKEERTEEGRTENPLYLNLEIVIADTLVYILSDFFPLFKPIQTYM